MDIDELISESETCDDVVCVDRTELRSKIEALVAAHRDDVLDKVEEAIVDAHGDAPDALKRLLDLYVELGGDRALAANEADLRVMMAARRALR